MCRLHREVNDCPANLNSLIVSWQQGCSLLDQDQGSKLRLVVLKHELSVFKLDFGMTAGDRDIVDSKVRLMTTT